MNADGSIRCGIGGCSTDLEGNLLFIFSGPSHAKSPLEAEREALIFLFLRIKENLALSGFYTLCTDSKILEEIFLKDRAGYREEDRLEASVD